MSEENVEVVRAKLEAFNRDDFDHVVAAFTEDCVPYEPPEMPDRLATGYRGHEGIREWAANLRKVGDVRFAARGRASAGPSEVNGLRRQARSDLETILPDPAAT